MNDNPTRAAPRVARPRTVLPAPAQRAGAGVSRAYVDGQIDEVVKAISAQFAKRDAAMRQELRDLQDQIDGLRGEE